MFTEIDSSEIIAYLADKSKSAGKTSSIVTFRKIHDLGIRMEELDSSLRVNTGTRSIRNFSAYCSPNSRLTDASITLHEINEPSMVSILNQYMPSASTIQVINKALNENAKR